MSRMVDSVPQYLIGLDKKWMSLEMMSQVYSKIPEIKYHVPEEKKDEKIAVNQP